MLFAPRMAACIGLNRIPVDSGEQFQVMLPPEVGQIMSVGNPAHLVPLFTREREKPTDTRSEPGYITRIDQIACLPLNNEISRGRSPGRNNRGCPCISLQHGSPESLVAFGRQQKELRFRHGLAGLLQGKLAKK